MILKRVRRASVFDRTCFEHLEGRHCAGAFFCYTLVNERQQNLNEGPRMTRCFALVILGCLLLVSSGARAEPPADGSQVKPRMDDETNLLPLLVRGAQKEIHRRLNLVLFKDTVSGETAALQVIPILPGCKLGLIYRF